MDYLSTELKRPVQLALGRFVQSRRQAASGNVDIAYLTPALHQGGSARAARVPSPRPSRGDKSFQLVLVVHRDSPAKSVGTWRARALRLATGGHPAARGAGERRPAAGTARVAQVHRPTTTTSPAAWPTATSTPASSRTPPPTNGSARGCAFCMPRRRCRPHNIAVSRRVDEPTRNALRQALLRLNPRDPAHRNVVESWTGTTMASRPSPTPSTTSSACSSLSRSSASAAAAAPPRRHRTASACGRWGRGVVGPDVAVFGEAHRCACTPRFAADGRP